MPYLCTQQGSITYMDHLKAVMIAQASNRIPLGFLKAKAQLREVLLQRETIDSVQNIRNVHLWEEIVVHLMMVSC